MSTCNGTAERAALLRCRSVIGRVESVLRRLRPVGGTGAGGGGTGAAAAAGAARLIADMIAGITMPLSRSIAWPAPSWLAALDRSPSSPPLPC